MSTEIGRDWVSRIPSLSDDANIQQAFRMYHYGNQDGSEPGPGDTISGVEGYFASLQSQITSITAGVDALKDLSDNAINLNDLDTIEESGTYRRSSAPIAARNYPELSAGLLFVAVTDGGAVYQEYQTIGGTSGTNNYYWRGKTAATNDWSEWAQASKSTHNHDSIYYRKTEVDARIASQTSMIANSVVITDAEKKLTTSSTISSTELGHLNNARSNIQDQIDGKANSDHNHDGVYHKIGVQPKIFVQSSTPSSGVQVNDLWFW